MKTKFKNSKIYLILLAFLFMFNGYGQRIDTIGLIGFKKTTQDSIKFRWNTKSAENYFSVYKAGFEARVLYVFENGQMDSASYLIACHSFDKIAQSIDTNNKSLLAVYAAINSFEQTPKLTPRSSLLQIKEYNENRDALWGMASFAADLDFASAEFMGLGLKVPRPSKADIYVSIAPLHTEEKNMDTLFFFISSEVEITQPIAPQIFAEENEKSIYLKWEHVLQNFTAYNLYKSDNINGKYLKLNNYPLLINSKQEIKFGYYIDSVRENYKAYYYKIEGIDMFGDKYISEVPLKAMGRDRTPPEKFKSIKTEFVNDSVMLLNWELDGSHSSDLDVIIVERSLKQDSGYFGVAFFKKPDLPEYFRDSGLLKGRGYYYRIYLVDTAGNYALETTYGLLPDRIPPAQPKKLMAKVNKEGVVKITWELGEEEDLKGYLLYCTFDLKSEFIGVINKPLYDTLYHDTLSLKMLNKEVFYKLIAVDINFNKSAESDIVKVMRPDTIPPLPPLITQYIATDSGILLNWNPSQSSDVKLTTLYRIDIQKSDTQILARFENDPALFFDTKCKFPNKYQYYLQTTDFDENSSRAGNFIIAKTMPPPSLPSFEDWSIAFDSINQQVRIHWNKSNHLYKECKVVIYKGPNPESLLILSTLDFSKGEITDKVFPYNNYYSYTLYLIFPDTRKTLMSNIKTVRVH
jgi:hypothetical protein